MKRTAIIGMSILGICGCLFISDRFQGYGEDAEYAKLQESWSEYQGEMNWSDADTKCKGLGMKLASREEFNAARAGDAIGKIRKHGNAFWTSELFGTERAHAYGTAKGSDFIQFKTEKNHTVCIRRNLNPL
jgi:hypothetical protein